MKLIKNAIVYKAELPAAHLLSDHLNENPFSDPQPTDDGSLGFIKRGENLVDVYPGGVAFTVRMADKIIPAAAVKAEVDKRAKALAESLGKTKVPKKIKAEIKDQVVLEFRLKALIKTTEVTSFYNLQTRHLIVSTSSQKTADRVTSLLVRAVGSVKTETINVSGLQHGLTTRISAWLSGQNEDAFGDFSPVGQVALSLGDQKVSVKVESLENAKDGLTEALAAGMGVDSVSLCAGNDIQFKLTSDFHLKSIDFPVASESADADDIWLHEASVQVTHVSGLMTALEDLLSYKEELKEAA
jgi:recombination associated protein RdgC